MKAISAMLVVAIALAPFSATAQTPATPASQPPDRAVVLTVAAGIMERARYCTLVTVGAGGHPQARIMDAFPPEAEMVVWMATTPLSRKVGEIRKDPRVTLSYFDAKTMGYVTVVGKATLVSDPAEKAKRWKDDWAKIYKDRNLGDDYLLIRVTPIRLEVSAEGEGVKNDPRTWRAAVVQFRSPAPPRPPPVRGAAGHRSGFHAAAARSCRNPEGLICSLPKPHAAEGPARVPRLRVGHRLRRVVV